MNSEWPELSSPSVSAACGSDGGLFLAGPVLAQEEPTALGPDEVGEDEAFVEDEGLAERLGDAVTEPRAHGVHPDDFRPSGKAQSVDCPDERDGEVEGVQAAGRAHQRLVSSS
jgi:hypothetical protein